MSQPTYRVVSLGGRVITRTLPVVSGPAGRSAYDMAVDEGFEGTLEEWLDSLRGDDAAATWADIADKPDFAPVATSGSYTDLDDTPVIPSTPGDVGADPAGAAAAARTAAEGTAAAALATHEADATGVHGIPNTALLETQTGAQTKATSAAADAVTTAQGYTDTALASEAAARDAAITAALSQFVDNAPPELDEWLEVIAAIQDQGGDLQAIFTQLAGKQTASAELTAIAALTTTVFGRNLLTQADAATVRTTLGLAAIATSASVDDLVESSTRKILTAAERTKLAGIATGATANATDAQLRDRTTHTGSQTAASISDFTEAVQDAVAALLASGANVTLSYDDSGNSLSVTAAGPDAEATRDAIGAALVGVGLVAVTVNDAGDTITISTTATANSTDAQLRDRSTHTGAQAISTVTGLQTALDAKQASFAATFCEASLGNPLNGAATVQTIPAGAFTKIALTNEDQDPGNNFTPDVSVVGALSTTGIYTPPSSGYYLVIAKVRFTDNAPTGVDFGIGAHTILADNRAFQWDVTPSSPASGRRYVVNYQRLTYLAAGDSIRMLAYADGTALPISVANFTILRQA